MRKPLLFLVLFAVVVLSSSGFVGCTSLLGDYNANGTVSSEAGTGTETGGMCTTACGSNPCVDLTTDNANCGACGTACNSGQTCQASACKCPQDKAFCGNQCVVASRMACGSTCSACLADEVCNQGCTAAPAPQFEKTPLDPTGWRDSAGAPIQIKLKATGIPGTLYECRTGPESTFTPTDPPWKPCDGAAGTNPVHSPTKDANIPEGSYRTEYRYRSDSYRSPTVAFQFYAHQTLDKAGTCPAAGTPAISDADFFTAAQQQPGFPSIDTFQVPGATPADPMFIRNPFIKIPFSQVHTVPGLSSWPNAGPAFDHVVNERSLRHKFVLNPMRTMMLVKRQYVNPKKGDCANNFTFGSQMAQLRGQTGRGPHKLDCEAFVLNVHGLGLCIGRDGMNKPKIQAVDMRVTNAAQGYGNLGGGTVTGIAGQSTLTGSPGANVSFLKDRWIYTVNGQATSHWYKVTNVVGQVLTLSEALKFDQTAVAWKYSFANAPDPVFIVPTGFAHLYDDGKNWPTANAAHGNFNPSFQTKCETAGCNTGKPWLTYLPP